MKFDENGKKISLSEGKKSASQEFLGKLWLDANKIAQYLNTDIPEIILKNGTGGDYTRSKKQLRVGFGDGEYTNQTRQNLVHEMLHHTGHDHGVVLGHSFMSHSVNDKISPILVRKIFKEQIND